MAAYRQPGPVRNSTTATVMYGTLCRMPGALPSALQNDSVPRSFADLARAAVPERGGIVEITGFGRSARVHVPVPGMAPLFIALKVDAVAGQTGPLFLQDAYHMARLNFSLNASGKHVRYVWRSQTRALELPPGTAIRVWQFRTRVLKTSGLDPRNYGVVSARRAWRQVPVTAPDEDGNWATGTPTRWLEQFVFEPIPEAARADRAA